MNRLNLGSAYYNALEAVATRRYTNGVMFAVNYTLMKLEDQINFFTDYDTDAVPRYPGRPAAASARHHHADRSAVRSGKRFGGNTHRRRRGADRRLAVQHHRRDPVGPAARAQWQRDPARSGCRAVEDEQSFERWFDNSSTALNNPRPDGTFAWTVLGPNDYRVVKQRFHDVNEPTEPQWSFSLFKNTARRRERCSSASRRSTSSTRGSTAGRTPIRTGQLRHRRHRQPGELPAHDPARGQVCDSKVAPAIAGSCNQDGLRHAGVRKPFESITAVPRFRRA